VAEGTIGYSDVRCSFCNRHNREVRVVAHSDIIICQVCVARCADIFDGDVGIEAPEGGWASRWPIKT